jgi:hypothetical protein
VDKGSITIMTNDIERKHERVTVNQTITIADLINGGNFGELLNVTVEGIMAITDKEIDTDSIFQLELNLPFDINGSSSIKIGADCLWCRKAENFHRYWAGFHIIDASDEALSQLKVLTEEYSK